MIPVSGQLDAADVPAFVQGLIDNGLGPFAVLSICTTEALALIRQGDESYWHAALIVAAIRDQELWRASGEDTFGDWLEDFAQDARSSPRTIREKIQSLRVGTAPDGLGLSIDDIVAMPPTTMTALIRSTAYDSVTGAIIDDDDPALPPGKYGRQAAREKFDEVSALRPGEARKHLAAGLGQHRISYSLDIGVIGPGSSWIWVGGIAAHTESGVHDIAEGGTLVPIAVARDLVKRLGNDWDALVERNHSDKE